MAATHLLTLSDMALGEAEARELASSSLADGSALAAYERWIRAQGGDPDPALLPRAPVVREVHAPTTGFVQAVRARQVAGVATALGAGRERKDDSVDHAVGVVCRVKCGERVVQGQTLAEIHARDDATAEAAEGALLSAYEIGDEAEHRALVRDVLR